MTFEHLSEVQPYALGSREAGNAALFYNGLHFLPSKAFFAQAGNLIVSAGHVGGDPESPLYVMNDPCDAPPRYCVFVDRLVPTIGPMPFAVLRRLICAPNFPKRGMAVVAGMGEIAFLADAVDSTHFSQTFTDKAAWNERERLQAIHNDVFGPESPLVPHGR